MRFWWLCTDELQWPVICTVIKDWSSSLNYKHKSHLRRCHFASEFGFTSDFNTNRSLMTAIFYSCCINSYQTKVHNPSYTLCNCRSIIWSFCLCGDALGQWDSERRQKFPSEMKFFLGKTAETQNSFMLKQIRLSPQWQYCRTLKIKPFIVHVWMGCRKLWGDLHFVPKLGLEIFPAWLKC